MACRKPGGCPTPVPALDPIEEIAVRLFFKCETQWAWSPGGFAPRYKDRLLYEVLEDVARWNGIEMNDDLLELIHDLEIMEINQSKKKAAQKVPPK